MPRILLVSLAAVLAWGCSSRAERCDDAHPCGGEGQRCDVATATCVPAGDAGAADAPVIDAPAAGDLAADAAAMGDAAMGDAAMGDAPADVPVDAAVAICSTAAPCSEPATPICHDGDCIPCGSNDQCAARDPALPICAPDGRCVECLLSHDCVAGTSPICEDETCRACDNATECLGRDQTTPACGPSGACVECRSHADCAGTIARPACDSATSTCVPCTADEQCHYFCDRDFGTGRCITEAEIRFVDRRGCAEPGTGTFNDPYCEITTAVAHLGLARYIYVFTGVYEPVSVSGQSFRLRADTGALVQEASSGASFAVGGGSVVEVQRLGVQASAGTAAGFAVTTGRLTLRNVRVEGLGDVGVRCTTGHLALDASAIVANAGGGLDLSSCTYQVVNSVIAQNGGATTSFGGARIATPGAGSTFIHNSVLANAAKPDHVAGVQCLQAAAVTNSIVWWNTPLEVGQGFCAVTYSNLGEVKDGTGNMNIAPALLGVGTGDYHYVAGSAGIDAADLAVAPPRDFDGQPRPYGSAPDLGAFEWRP